MRYQRHSKRLQNKISLTKYLGQGIKEWTKKICGRQPLKIFTWYILEYLDPFVDGDKAYLGTYHLSMLELFAKLVKS